MTTAHLKITTDSGWTYEKDIPAATDTISVKDKHGKYILTVTKDSYPTWTDTLTAAELKQYSKDNPLIVMLQSESETVTDIDGNIYHTIKIGNQTWMVENLKAIRYNDSTSIPNVTDDNTWMSLTTPGYCWYNNSASYKEIYGALYNWYAVNTGKLAPKGWHVPTENDWKTLEEYVGSASTGGGKLKETGYDHWLYPNLNATNTTGFTGLPGGYRSRATGYFQYNGKNGCWWSSTGSISKFGRFILNYDRTDCDYDYDYGTFGFSVRCIKD
jgi:uncharacterized protein (TIGR02145 family)